MKYQCKKCGSIFTQSAKGVMMSNMCINCGHEMLPVDDTFAKNIIHLWNDGGEYLIIKCPSGVKYSNQTGGLWCNHQVAEGVLLPLHQGLADELGAHVNFNVADYDPAFIKHTKPEILAEMVTKELDEIEKIIQDILKPNYTGYNVTIDRDNPENQEAWFHLTFKRIPDQKPSMAVFEDFLSDEFKAILTYENSD